MSEIKTVTIVEDEIKGFSFSHAGGVIWALGAVEACQRFMMLELMNKTRADDQAKLAALEAERDMWRQRFEDTVINKAKHVIGDFEELTARIEKDTKDWAVLNPSCEFCESVWDDGVLTHNKTCPRPGLREKSKL